MRPTHLWRHTLQSSAGLRRLAVAALTALFIAAPGPVAAADIDLLNFQAAVAAAQAVDPTLEPPPSDGSKDFVVAGFQQDDMNWAVSAHSGPAGEDPFGHVSLTVPELSSDDKQGRWRVICVNVGGVERTGGFALITVVPSNGLPTTLTRASCSSSAMAGREEERP
jgi:hypothetical protein